MNKFKAEGKSRSLQSVAFGEPVTLPGGNPTSRVRSRMYGKGKKADTAGGPLPRGSLYDR